MTFSGKNAQFLMQLWKTAALLFVFFNLRESQGKFGLPLEDGFVL
jgi:hypothetical protein